MTTDEYIASGILEMYASGGLPAAERQEVELMLKQHPELLAELNSIEETLERYAQLHATQPQAALKNRILTAIQNSEKSTPVAEPKLDEPDRGDLEPKVIPFSSTPVPEIVREKSFNWLTAAAVILLLISAGLNFYFYNNWRNSESTLQLTLNQQQELAQNYQQAKFELVQTEKALHVLEDLDTKHIALTGLPKSPDSRAVIHWDPKSKMVLLEVKKLPIAAAGKQYQLWALKNGKPINAGLFNPADTLMGIQHMKTIQDAEAFAMTLEPIGGSENPTMDEMYIMGKM